MSTTDESDVPPPLSFQLSAAIRKLRNGDSDCTGENPAIRIRNGNLACTHTTGAVMEVDEKSRTVTCSKCGHKIDPFDAMLIVARSEQRMQREYKTIIDERTQRRGFYAEQQTVRANGCRHKSTFRLLDGRYKCCRCDKILEGEPLKAARGDT